MLFLNLFALLAFTNAAVIPDGAVATDASAIQAQELRSLTASQIEAYTSSNAQIQAFHGKWKVAYPDANRVDFDAALAAVLKGNLLNINAVNAQNAGYTIGVNEHIQISSDAFNDKFLMKAKFAIPQKPATPLNAPIHKRDISKFPRNLDWSYKDGKNYVTPPKRQTCGTCWANSAVGAIESAYLIYDKKMPTDRVKLSVPHAIAGGMKATSSQCDGGWPAEVFDYVYENGIAYNAAYYMKSREYEDEEFPDNFPNVPKSFGDDALIMHKSEAPMPGGKEGYIERLNVQPFVILIAASHLGHLKDGIWNPPVCGNVNHAVLLIGYNQDEQYWLAKNSWGSSWGIGGNFKIKMTDDMSGTCGMYEYPVKSPGLNFEKSKYNSHKPFKNPRKL